MTQKTFVREEVAKNNTEDSLWFIIDSKVYDVTDFIDAHPGGEAVLKQGKASLSCCCYISFTTAEILGAIYKARSLRALLSKSHRFDELIRGAVAGTDCTDAFYNLHRQEVLQKYSSLCIGQIEGEQSKVIEHKPGDLSVIPYGEPTWLSPQFKSPYYNESHRRLQKAMRIFTDEELYPIAQECEKTGKHIPQGLIDSMSEKGILHMRIGPGKHLHGVNLMNGAVSSVGRFSPLPIR
jgi:Cytochrome b5-like Heme/Steroid binding domain/Acyl-CoA dehydrogenase, N-terminal domain